MAVISIPDTQTAVAGMVQTLSNLDASTLLVSDNGSGNGGISVLQITNMLNYLIALVVALSP